MNQEEFEEKKALIENALAYRFHNSELLKRAMIHRSYWNEHKEGSPGHNERLEFLGDAVLNLIVAHYLYDKLPILSEGQLTQMRSRIVDSSSCFLYCENMGISSCLFVGKGELYNKGKGRETMLGDFFEALLAAVYLDGGLEAAHTCFRSHFEFTIEKDQGQASQNWKSILQDLAQKQFGCTPLYKMVQESGPEHAKRFKEAVVIDGEVIAEGEGLSRKEAQFQAAKQALETLKKRVS